MLTAYFVETVETVYDLSFSFVSPRLKSWAGNRNSVFTVVSTTSKTGQLE